PSDMGDNAAQKQAQADAEKDLNELLPKIPGLTIQIKGAEPSAVSVSLDDVVVPPALIEAARPTNPGKHRVIAARGSERYESELTLTEKEQKTITFEFRAAPVVAAAPVASPAAEVSAPQPKAAPVLATAEPSGSVLVPIGIGVTGLG